MDDLIEKYVSVEAKQTHARTSANEVTKPHHSFKQARQSDAEQSRADQQNRTNASTNPSQPKLTKLNQTQQQQQRRRRGGGGGGTKCHDNEKQTATATATATNNERRTTNERRTANSNDDNQTVTVVVVAV